MERQEIYDQEGKLLGIMDNIENIPPGLGFYGTADDYLQIATFRHPKGHILKSHRHLFRKGPEVIRSQEIFIIFTGRVTLRIYDNQDKLFKTQSLTAGDFYIVFSGGSGYTIEEENTKMLEVKYGPFPGSDLDRVLI